MIYSSRMYSTLIWAFQVISPPSPVFSTGSSQIRGFVRRPSSTLRSRSIFFRQQLDGTAHITRSPRFSFITTQCNPLVIFNQTSCFFSAWWLIAMWRSSRVVLIEIVRSRKRSVIGFWMVRNVRGSYVTIDWLENSWPTWGAFCY